MEVSVIIPIYNVSKFIDRGIKNILNQSYKDFEIILVDDGSTDDSFEKCKKWSTSHENIHVLHQENKGAGSARNLGIENAEGKYIYFFDIDDECSPRLLDYNLSIMNQYNIDFIVFGYTSVTTTYVSKTIVSFPELIINCNEELRNIYIEQFMFKLNGFPWNKFYRKSFLDFNKIRFENQKIQQDEVFNLKVYKYLQKAYISPEILYTYYVYEKSNTRSGFISDRFDIYKSVRYHFENLLDFWKLKNEKTSNYLNNRFYNNIIQCLFFNICHKQCKWTMAEKKEEMLKILTHQWSKEAIQYARINKKDMKNYIYLKIISIKSIYLLLLFCKIKKFLEFIGMIN